MKQDCRRITNAGGERKTIDRVDPGTGRVVARLPVGGIPIRIGIGFGSVWVRDDSGRVLRITPQR